MRGTSQIRQPDDVEFLTRLAAELRLPPPDAGFLASLWRDRKFSDMVQLIAERAGLPADKRPALDSMILRRDLIGILQLIREAATPIWLQPAFLISLAFFAISGMFRDRR